MLFYALLLVCLAEGASAQTCDDNIFINCLGALNQDLNLTDPAPYARANVFRNNVEMFYQKSPTNGLRTVCKAFRVFKTCMGPNYALCMNPGNFIGIGLDTMNAYIFISTFNTMHYTCGAGFQVYLSNAKCMMQSWSAASAEQLNACRYQYEAKANAQPDAACIFANTYLNCWEQQFLSVCGQDAKDTQFWGCEYGRINAFTRFPACPTTCVLPHNGGVIG